MMALWYLVLAAFLAVTLNQRNRFLRGLDRINDVRRMLR
jgi:hypothetical protein